MLFQTTDNVVPVKKKTTNSKIKDRTPAAVKPKATGKPRAAGKLKTADNRMAAKSKPSLKTVVIERHPPRAERLSQRAKNL